MNANVLPPGMRKIAVRKIFFEAIKSAVTAFQERQARFGAVRFLTFSTYPARIAGL